MSAAVERPHGSNLSVIVDRAVPQASLGSDDEYAPLTPAARRPQHNINGNGNRDLQSGAPNTIEHLDKTPTRSTAAELDGGQHWSNQEYGHIENGPSGLVYHAVDTAAESPSETADLSATELRPEDAVDADASGISASSSPDVDYDRPLTTKISAPLQRGDSTSSDSSTSGLSRASSSSSVYATPFRMTPMRPLPSNSRPSSYIASRNDSYFNLAPSRYPARGGYVSARSSFSAPSGGPVRVVGPAMTSNVSSLANSMISAGSSGSSDPPHISNLGHRSQGSTATIGPHMTLLPSIESPANEPPILISPPRPIPSAMPSTQRGSVSTIGTSSASYESNGTASQLRPPNSPTLDMLASSAGSQGTSLSPRPQRPMLDSRNPSTVSLGSLAHKRINDFELGEVIGEGSYSIVHLATDKTPPHRRYAIKQLNKKHIIKERKVKYVTVEKETLARLDRHPGIVRLYWTFHDEHSLYFVLELAENGEILKYLQDFGSFEVSVARFYAAQILSALEYMHKKGVIHRDLKPENILLDPHMRVKITDFGTAKLLQTPSTAEKLAEEINQSRSNSFVGTAQYVCPELLTAKPIPDPAVDPDAAVKALPPPQAADFWAFGCVLYQFICGQTPFRAPNEYLIFQKITKLDYDFPEDFPEDAKDLIRRLLVLDPQQRLGTANGVREVKEHPFFATIDWATIWTVDPPALRTGITPPVVGHKHILALEESSLYDISGDDGDAEEDSLAADDTDAPSEEPRQSEESTRQLPQAGPHSPSIPWPPNGKYHGSSNFNTIRGRHRVSASSEPTEMDRPSSRSTTNSWQRGEPVDRTRSRSSSQSRWSRFLSLPRSAMQKMKAPSRRKSLSRVVS